MQYLDPAGSLCRMCVSPDHPTAQCPSVAPFYRSIGRYPLLTREQTLAATQEIERLTLDLWRLVLERIPTPEGLAARTPEAARREDKDGEILLRLLRVLDDRPAIVEAHRARDRARNAFLSANLRLVISGAVRYLGQGLGMTDLIQEGTLGLWKGLNRFEWRRGYQFSTYGNHWVRHGILRALANQRQDVRVPVHTQIERAAYRRCWPVVANRLGRPPTAEEMGAALNFKPRQIERARERHVLLSLSAPLDPAHGEDGLFEHVLPDARPSPLDDVAGEEIRAKVRGLLDRLSPTQRTVLV